jgi:hypothetical protein
MRDPNKSGLENDCKEFKDAFQGILSWKWDSRFETVLAEFGAEKRGSVRAILERYLKITWDSSNMDNAPDTVRTINSHLGGLRSGQLLFTSDLNRDSFIFCAWWPWGGGKTLSIRLAPSYMRLSDPEKAAKIQRFKGCFGV